MRLNVQRLATASVVFAISLALLVYGKTFLIPLAIAILLWSLVDAIRQYYARITIAGRQMPSFLTTTMAILSIAFIFFVATSIVASQSDSLHEAAPVFQQKFNALINSILQKLPVNTVFSAEHISDKIDIGAILSVIAGSAGSLVTNIALIFIYLGFMLAEQKNIPKKLVQLERVSAKAKELPRIATDICASVQRYIWMKSMISALTGLISYAVLYLVGVDFAAVWGLLIFFLNFIPNIGSFLGVVFPALLALIQFDTLTPFLLVTFGLGFVQFFIGNVIEPSYLGRSLNLSSLMIVLFLTFWGLVWGLAGMFLAVPLMVMCAIVCAHFSNTRWIAVLLSSDGQLMVHHDDDESHDAD